MKLIFKPASRLIIGFILTMIVSGVILTILSINSISNFKELTEKKVDEEQMLLANKLSEDFQALVESTVEDYRSQESKNRSTPGMDDRIPPFRAPIESPFSTDSLGRLINPWNVEGIGLQFRAISNPLHRKNIRSGEENEFQRNDPIKAVRYYYRSLIHASCAGDSVESLNALARVYMKSELYSEARSIYSMIISEFPNQLNNAGFPFAYYAILNLLDIGMEHDSVAIYSQVSHFLSGIRDGMIPYNLRSEDILHRIAEWMKVAGKLNDNQRAEFSGTIDTIRNNISFIATYSKLIKSSIQDYRKPIDSTLSIRYKVIPAPSTNAGNTMIIYPGKETHHGFLLNVDSVWSYFIGSKENIQSEFNYRLDLVRSGEHVSTEKGTLETYHLLSSWFPECELRVRLKDADMVDIFVMKRRWSYAIALILLLGAMLIGILLILRDIIRERRLSQLRSDFVSNVTHELRTPLTSIYLFTESILAERVPTDSGNKEYLNIILRETERLKRMINNILDFSKKEKGKVDYKSENVHMTMLIKSALKELDYWLKELGFKVKTQLEDEVYVNGDHDALKQVVINLLDNAIKYSGKHKEISILLSRKQGRLQIQFTDKGIGIPKDHLGAIFEKFYRVQDPVVEGIGGTGLGLTVVKEIVEAHGGDISVISEPGKGSTFTVNL